MHTEIQEASTVEPVSTPAVASASTCPVVFWKDHQRDNAHIFPTPESWSWFVRQHRAELVAAGALCYVAGRILVVPEAFDSAVIKIGQRLAAARSA